MSIEPTDDNSSYIGDGVYATADGYGNFILWTERQEGRHWLSLDRHALEALDQAAQRFGLKPANQK